MVCQGNDTAGAPAAGGGHGHGHGPLPSGGADAPAAAAATAAAAASAPAPAPDVAPASAPCQGEPYKPRCILLTGGAGFIGSHVAIRLVKRYPDVKVSGKRGTLPSNRSPRATRRGALQFGSARGSLPPPRRRRRPSP